MNRICLVALVGLPASGKTTLCRYLMNHEEQRFNICHLCYDNFMQFNSENPTEYREQRDYILKYLTKIVESFKAGNLHIEQTFIACRYKNNNSKDIVVLCDDNHYYRSMRYKLFQIAREYSVSFCQIYFENILKLAIERNNLRTGKAKVPHEVILQMSERLEPPNSIEHKWEENTLVLKNLHAISNPGLEVVSYITKILDTPLQPSLLNKSKNLTSQSLGHELDLLIRKRISTIMTSAEINNKNLIARQLNYKRKQILKQFHLELHDNMDDSIDLKRYVDMLK